MRHHRLASVCILLACVGCSAATIAQSTAPSNGAAKFPVGQNHTSDHGLTISSIVGNWEASHLGHQILTARPDGTATIEMSLTPMAAVLYGRHVTLNLRWTLDGNLLTQQIIGGSPANSVKKLIAKFGGTQCYRIMECQLDHLLVSNSNSDNEPIRWTAVSSVQ